MLSLPRLYALLDSALLPPKTSAVEFAQALFAGGARLLQYRNKQGSAREILAETRNLVRLARSHSAQLILNDRADLALLARCDGVHLGQDDLSPDDARAFCPAPFIIGTSTHNLDQLREADASSADYIALGPIFATSSKQRPDPVVGLNTLRAARSLTRKPIVAIGGITLENCRSVIDAGADSVAVISALAGSPRKSAEDFLALLM